MLLYIIQLVRSSHVFFTTFIQNPFWRTLLFQYFFTWYQTSSVGFNGNRTLRLCFPLCELMLLYLTSWRTLFWMNDPPP
jgi:hypothetical protein